MIKKSNFAKAAGLCLSFTLALGVMQGCGTNKNVSQNETQTETETKTEEAEETKENDPLADMKEFKNPDESVSIYLDKDWVTEDLGMEEMDIHGWFCARSKGNDEVVVLMQFPKASSVMPVSGIDEVKSLFAESYSFTDSEGVTDVPEVPGMSNLSVEKGQINDGSTTCDAYTIYGETDYAYYALMFGADNMDDAMVEKIKVSCTTFKETAPEEDDSTTVSLTDTVRWFNASYAILTEINGWDYNRFAGVAANEVNKEAEIESLKEWWDVTDRASADETLEWALTEGHRKAFAEDMALFESLGIKDAADRKAFLLENFEMTDEEAQSNADAYAFYEQYGASAIDGWDYCRAMNLLSFYYIAGYYTEEEALDKSLEIAQTMQPLFDSWESLVDSYLRGYEYWSSESSDERREVYEDLLSRDDNPFTVDYNTTLEKTW